MRKKAAKLDAFRRKGLKILFYGILALFLYPFIKFFLSVTPTVKRRFVKVGKVNELPLMKPILVQGIWIVKISKEVRAYPNRCTHLGCPLGFNGRIFVCSCHGSKFDIMGRWLGGPARKDLPLLKVKITPDGTVWIKEVAA